MVNKIFWFLARSVVPRPEDPEIQKPRKIVIMRYGFLGDVLQTIPVLKAIRRTWPGCTVDYLVGTAYVAALSKNPMVKEIHIFPEIERINLKTIHIFIKVICRLRSNRYDMAIALGPDPFYGMLAWLSGISIRIGMITNANKAAFLTKWIETPLDSKRRYQQSYLDVLQLIGVQYDALKDKIEIWTSEEDKNEVAHILSVAKEPVIAFFAGGGVNKYRPWAERKWPLDKWTELVSIIDQKYTQVTILLLGADSEIEINKSIVRSTKSNNTINLTNKVSINQLALLLKKCKVLVCNDSMPVFVASAVDCPSIVLYGPEWPERTGPINAKDWHPIFIDLPCRKHCCSFPETAPNCSNECIKNISVESVWKEVNKIGR